MDLSKYLDKKILLPFEKVNMKVKMKDIPAYNKYVKDLVKEIKTKYPTFLGYPVYSSRFGQSKLNSGIELLKEFPEMFEDKEMVKKTLELAIKLQRKDLPAKEIQSLSIQMNELLNQLEVTEDVFCELRFEQLNFELIQSLKADPIINSHYTDQQKRSIAVILFRVNEFEIPS
jgi:hypothetical protein